MGSASSKSRKSRSINTEQDNNGVNSKKPKATDPQTTIMRLREAVSNQEKREEHIENKVKLMVQEAKLKMSQGDKKGALFAMKRKKLFEQEIDKIQNVKMTLETQVLNLESTANNAQTFSAMQQGSKTMQKIRKDVGIEKVDDLMDTVREEMDMANDISNAMGQQLDPMMGDDDELLRELAMLEQAELNGKMPMPATNQLPTVPNNKNKFSLFAADKNKRKEQDDMKKLEAELAGL